MPRFASVVVVVASLVASGLGGSSAASAGTLASTPHTWTDQHAPAPRYHSGRLLDVDCPATEFCMAVGARPDDRGFAEVRSGGHWRPIPAPAAKSLTDVSCATSSVCMAVGVAQVGGKDVPAAWIWDGDWTNTEPIDFGTQTEYFSDVACPSATDCTAVGVGFDTARHDASFAEHWNGSSWQMTLQQGPGPTVILEAVACTSTTFCAAVGQTGKLGDRSTYVQQWNGTAWQEITDAETAPTPASVDLLDVTCPAAGECTAIGGHTNEWRTTTYLVTRLHAGQWHSYYRQGPRTNLQLSGIHLGCSSATNCIVVVRRNRTVREPDRKPERTLVGVGDTWTAGVLRDAHGRPILAEVAGVSCRQQPCRLAGFRHSAVSDDTTARAFRLASGAAVSERVPTPLSRQYSTLGDISCANTTNCVVVGHRGQSPHGASMLETYRAGAWRIAPQSRPELRLQSVSCPSSDRCWAVGFLHRSDRKDVLYLDRWNGTRWRLRPFPVPPGPTPVRSPTATAAVSCPSSTFCMVVQGEATSAARWIAGSGWQAAPVAGETTAGWTSVSCTSASFCLAASSYGNVARWTGSIWRRVFNPQQVGNYWASVSCVSPSFCMVVGRREAHLLPGAAEWNGTSLVREPTVLATGANVQQIDSVSCVSATDCTAVGYDGPSYDNVTSWVQRWDGTQWAIEPSIHSGSAEQLHGIACVASTCLAVGDRVDGVRLPFAERGV